MKLNVAQHWTMLSKKWKKQRYGFDDDDDQDNHDNHDSDNDNDNNDNNDKIILTILIMQVNM